MRESTQEHTRKYKCARQLGIRYPRREDMEINLKYITFVYGEWIYVAQDGKQIKLSSPR
jgi:hypothetical protein